MKRLLVALLALPWLASAQPAIVSSKPCLMDGTGCFSTAFSNITGISASKLLGRGSAGSGAAQEITPGTGLTISGTTLTPDVSGSGASGRVVLWSGAGTLTSDAGLTYSGTGTGTVLRIGSAGTGLSEISAGVLGVGTGAAGSAAGTVSAATVLVANGSSGAPSIAPAAAPTVGFRFYTAGPQYMYSQSAAHYWGGAGVGTGYMAFDPDLSGLQIDSAYSLSWGTSGATSSLFLSRRADATLQLGAADSGTPVAQTLTVQGATGTNVAGQDFTIQGSLGTGSAASGKIVFKVGTPNASGSTQHTPNTVLTLQDTGTGGTASPAVISAGPITSPQYRLSALNTAPSSATDTGTLGEIRIAADYIYVCVATDTWVRAALATWP